MTMGGLRWWLACAVVSGGVQAKDALNLYPDSNVPFVHGVASADPTEDSVLIWTRVNDIFVDQVTWSIWDPSDPLASRENPLKSGNVTVSPESDMTVTVDVTGLASGTSYRYQFETNDGRVSMQGKTKTVKTDAQQVKLAFLSCTSIWSGYYNFYRHLAQDDQIDLVMHLGDVIYPDIDPDETLRIPFGMCNPQNWTRDLSEGNINDNQDPFLRDFVRSLDCEGSMLYHYRWIHALNLLDPDYRAARAAHPFMSTLDNHDVINRESSETSEARQASVEWIPMRYSISTRYDGERFIDTLRRVTYGDIVDVFMLDTWTYAKNVFFEGLLGKGQVDWLERELGTSKAKWRIFGSAKTFMPFTLNELARFTRGPILLCIFISSLLLGMCLCAEKKFGKENRLSRSDGPVFSFDAIQEERSSRMKPVVVRDSVSSIGDIPMKSTRPGCFGEIKASHKNSPFCLRCCTCCGVCVLFVTLLVGIAVASVVLAMFTTSPGLAYFNTNETTWDGSPGSREEFFDLLETTNSTSNNFWAVGDMHWSFAADVFRFSDDIESFLSYNSEYEGEDIDRFGVEMLGASGTRGNLDEKVYELTFHTMPPGGPVNKMVSSFLENILQGCNPHYRFYDGSSHGYGLLNLNETKIEAHFLQFPIREITDEFTNALTLILEDGANKWSPFDDM